MERGPKKFNPDAVTREVIDKLQRKEAQRTGEVPRFPFVTGPDGALHELVEEDVRPDPEDAIRKIENNLGVDNE